MNSGPRGKTTKRAQPDGRMLTRGILILQPYIDWILDGTKTWEIRGRVTKVREPIALIQSKSGLVVGTCDLVDCVGPLSLAEYKRNASKARVPPTGLPYPTTYAWVLKNARRLPKPVPYRHPSGAVIWVTLEDAVTRALQRHL